MTHHDPSRKALGAGSIALATLLALASCGGGEVTEMEELETVDVTPALEVDTSEDPQGRARSAELVGILPGDFPADLPLYLPASLIDFDETASGRPTVSLLTPEGISTVRRVLFARAREQGWTAASGDGGAIVLRKGGRTALLRLEEARPGTVYRFEY